MPNLQHSERIPAWSCIGPGGCTCAARKPGAPSCRGDYGQHCEEWRYRTEVGVSVEDDGRVVVGGDVCTVCELTVYTNIYVRGQARAFRISPAALNLHLPFPVERPYDAGERCTLLSAPCFPAYYGTTSTPWEELVRSEDGVRLGERGIIVAAPFERGQRFWEWMSARHREMLVQVTDMSKVWKPCSHCAGEGWVRR